MEDRKRRVLIAAIIVGPLLLLLAIALFPVTVVVVVILCIRKCTQRGHRDITDVEQAVQRRQTVSLSTYIQPAVSQGYQLDLDQCVVEWNHDDNVEVGQSTVATVTLVCRNSLPYVLDEGETFTCSVQLTETGATIPHVVEPFPPNGNSILSVSFTTRISGKYKVDIEINGRRLAMCPVFRNYRAGPVDPTKTLLLEQREVLILVDNVYYHMYLTPKDRFGNAATLSQEMLIAEVRKNSVEGELINSECVAEQQTASVYEVRLKVNEKGHYVGCIKYDGKRIGPPSFTIICLSESEEKTMQQKLSSGLFTRFDAKLIQGSKQKHVSCQISGRTLKVRKCVAKSFPTKTVFTCRMCAATKINFLEEPQKFTLDDGLRTPLIMSSKQRELLGAVFYSHVLHSVGGSETFEDKRKFFYSELRNYHSQRSRTTFLLTISRESLLQNAIQELMDVDWFREFKVYFAGEFGSDYGGVRREFFDLLCLELFEHSGLFKRFQNDPQGLLHPTPKRGRRPHLTSRYYEFAGKVVGKCLYECAVGQYPILVKARFTRSFLAQIIGLCVNYKYFESDDPDLYTTKIKYILENEVESLELVFTEEEFDSSGGNPREVPLKSRGRMIPVTDHNKLEYLDLLAQYKLCERVKGEITEFLKGLNSIIPEDLLSVFDENELELLMCGLETVDDEDLKRHTKISRSGEPRFCQIVSWFWVLVKSLTQEERSRLIQFVTGSSQIPPGGFKELRPQFEIIHAPTHGKLPEAHTCFNQLCLPTYDSYEEFQSKLLTAINEGSQGFGFI